MNYKNLLKGFLISIFSLITVALIKWKSVNDLPKCLHLNHHHPLSLKENPEGCRGHLPTSLNISSLKTGDILLLCYDDYRSIFSAIFYNSLWTHTAIVYISPEGEPYIFEAANYRPPYIADILRIPLLKWMNINRNVRAVAWLPINKAISEEVFEKYAAKYQDKNVSIEGLSLGWLRFLTVKKLREYNKSAFFLHENENEEDKQQHPLTCHELTISFLQDCGVFEKEYTPCSFLPSSIYHRKIKTTSEYNYADPIQVSFKDYTSKFFNLK